jgi:hypothetical protein
MDMSEWIQPLGIATLSSLILTIGLSLLRKKNPRLLMKWHKIQAFITLGLALLHFIVMNVAE